MLCVYDLRGWQEGVQVDREIHLIREIALRLIEVCTVKRNDSRESNTAFVIALRATRKEKENEDINLRIFNRIVRGYDRRSTGKRYFPQLERNSFLLLSRFLPSTGGDFRSEERRTGSTSGSIGDNEKLSLQISQHSRCEFVNS